MVNGFSSLHTILGLPDVEILIASKTNCRNNYNYSVFRYAKMYFGTSIINFFAKSFVVFIETTIFVASIYKGGTQPT